MEKRTLLAILFSLVILTTWSLLAPKPHHIDSKEVAREIRPRTPITTPQEIALPAQNDPTGVIEIEDAEIHYGKQSGRIDRILFKDFNYYAFALSQGFNLAGVKFSEVRSENGVLIVSGEDSQKKITLRFTFRNSSVINRLDVEIQNLTLQTINLPLKLILAGYDFADKDFTTRFNQGIIALPESIVRPNLKNNFTSPLPIDFIAFRDRYFCAILRPHSGKFQPFIEKVSNRYALIGLQSSGAEVAARSTQAFRFDVYIGPQNIQQLRHLNERWQEVVNFGFFDGIAKFLFGVVRALHVVTRNWGLAIILFSIIIFLALFPLTLKQLRSMKDMQAVQPHIEKLKKMHKDNPQKLNKEIMELYKEHKINPLGGCLPLVLQIPIFFSLYQALMRSVELKGATFLWVKDLSEPDRAFILKQALPLLGKDINILPLLMLVVMFWQQKTSMKSSSGVNAEQQKIMSVLFPLLFGFIFYNMPSGLVLYWLFNSALMAISQLRMVKNA